MPTVLITGANRGIGLEFARQYAADGWEVIATARQSSPELESSASGSNRSTCSDLDAVAAFGRSVDRLDLLIANAGTCDPKQAESGDEAAPGPKCCVTNTIAPYLLARSVLRQVGRSKRQADRHHQRLGSIGESSGGYVPYRSPRPR